MKKKHFLVFTLFFALGWPPVLRAQETPAALIGRQKIEPSH